MKVITTKKGKLKIIDVPTTAIEIEVVETKIGWIFDYYTQLPRVLENYVAKEVRANTTLLGTITDGKLDFDAEPYVEQASVGSSMFFENYVKLSAPHVFAEDSFLSLLTSHNIEYAGKKIVILTEK